MNYNVSTIPLFDKQAKRLAKKYPSLKTDMANLLEQLSANPITGKPLGNNFYKIRLPISSKGRGKSGGGRVITYVKVRENQVYLTSIYDKSEKNGISTSELDLIFKLLP